MVKIFDLLLLCVCVLFFGFWFLVLFCFVLKVGERFTSLGQTQTQKNLWETQKMREKSDP